MDTARQLTFLESNTSATPNKTNRKLIQEHFDKRRKGRQILFRWQSTATGQCRLKDGEGMDIGTNSFRQGTDAEQVQASPGGICLRWRHGKAADTTSMKKAKAKGMSGHDESRVRRDEAQRRNGSFGASDKQKAKDLARKTSTISMLGHGRTDPFITFPFDDDLMSVSYLIDHGECLDLFLPSTQSKHQSSVLISFIWTFGNSSNSFATIRSSKLTSKSCLSLLAWSVPLQTARHPQPSKCNLPSTSSIRQASLSHLLAQCLVKLRLPHCSPS